MPRILPALFLIALGSPALAETEPNVFMDDRSSPESVVISFYNAIHRHEYPVSYTHLTLPTKRIV